MKSQLCQAQIYHHRLRPTEHKFRDSLLYYTFDLDELEQLDQEHWFFRHNGPGLISLLDSDYLTPGPGKLKDKLLTRLREKPYCQQIDQVMLVTSARSLGYAFNPVSFFYCYDRAGAIVAVAAEVNNTFGERHLYILDHDCELESQTRLGYQTPKRFHVSPFNDMSGSYRFEFSDPKKQLAIAIDLVTEGVTKMKTAVQGKPQPFTGRNLLKAALLNPMGNFRVMPRIHWEAFVLYFRKKLAFFSSPLPSSPDTHQAKAPSFLQAMAQRMVMKALGGIQHGRLEVRLPDGTQTVIGQPDGDSHRLWIKSYRFFTQVLRSGDIGFGEAYTDGLIESDDLSGLLQLFLKNRGATINEQQPLLSSVGRAMSTLWHWRRGNSLRGSQENISAHYDLSNAMFECFLDPSMTYSSGLFSNPQDSLAQAQQQKLDAIIARAEIGPDDHVLEIGCGWGSLAIRAAQTTGCRVTGITLSAEQLEYAQQRVLEAGLQHRIDLRLCDYREMNGVYDRIISIEMLEAVGHEHQGTFLQACDRLLRPGGRAVLQAITMADDQYQSYLREADWIQRYIFPGGSLVSLGHLKSLAHSLTSFQMDQPTMMGHDYARTLQLWREQFHLSQDRILALGFDQRFVRMWHYYFCYCEAGFLGGPIDTAQVTLSK